MKLAIILTVGILAPFFVFKYNSSYQEIEETHYQAMVEYQSSIKSEYLERLMCVSSTSGDVNQKEHKSIFEFIMHKNGSYSFKFPDSEGISGAKERFLEVMETICEKNNEN
ncbi:hypothetical protein IB292_03340 [Vibrio parahaemolyticus]|uniref:Uncharacterized protein n=1 Tax=Vibrio parahaemolyticus TaxID=670 RepID=A0A9Q3UA23_VIBPH|nr:hypothetical protein [Vibrio parahaemolyticus]MCC3804067.1 hypothetical protein [Vibrio parahaemolyticus]